MQDISHRFVLESYRFPVTNLLAILFGLQSEHDTSKIYFLIPPVSQRAAFPYVMKHGNPLLAINEKPDFAIARVKWRKHVITGAQMKPMAASCFPNHDDADWHVGVHAVE
jgi:hypothetical protein